MSGVGVQLLKEAVHWCIHSRIANIYEEPVNHIHADGYSDFSSGNSPALVKKFRHKQHCIFAVYSQVLFKDAYSQVEVACFC